MSLTCSATIIENASKTVSLSLSPQISCTGCGRGCGSANASTTNLMIPANVFPPLSSIDLDTKIEIEITGKDHLLLLVNSIILPVLGFVLGSFIAAWFNPSDPVVLCGAMTGFLVGMKLCSARGFGVFRANGLQARDGNQ